jgi:hypothetical protein
LLTIGWYKRIMTTVVNTTTPQDTNPDRGGWMAVVLVLIVIVLFFVFGLPVIQRAAENSNMNVYVDQRPPGVPDTDTATPLVLPSGSAASPTNAPVMNLPTIPETESPTLQPSPQPTN